MIAAGFVAVLVVIAYVTVWSLLKAASDDDDRMGRG